MKKSENKEIILDILYEAFLSNEASTDVVWRGPNEDQRFKLLLRYSYFFSEHFGKVYLGKQKNACALIIDSEKKKMTFRLIWWYAMLLFRAIGFSNLRKISKRLQTLNENRPKDSHIYIWYIGVRNSMQGKGFGSALMTEILEEHKDRIVCLETTKKENESFYEKLGFQKIGNIEGLYFPFVSFRMDPS